MRATSDEELQRISVAFRASDIKPNILHLAFDPRSSAIAEEVERGHYDLVVVGAENRAIQHRLFFGYENERLIRGTRIPVVVVVPNLSRLGANDGRCATPRLILIGGGARSGKSRFALVRALDLGQRRLFIATAEPSDDEMRERIARHRAERGAGFDTLEEPRALSEALAADRDHDVVVVDCLTIWISNLLVGGASADDVQERLAALLAALARRRSHVVIVSNEVGLGLVPETPLGRVFRDLTGRAHQRIAAVADELYLAVMGVVLRLRPAPVELVDRHEGPGRGVRVPDAPAGLARAAARRGPRPLGQLLPAGGAGARVRADRASPRRSPAAWRRGWWRCCWRRCSPR